MQLRKFYGRTLGGALAHVKRALGPDALILESRSIDPRGAEGRLNPGARYEILAVRDESEKSKVESLKSKVNDGSGTRTPTFDIQTIDRRHGFLADLGALREQIRELLDGKAARESARVDLGDYHSLVESGVTPGVVAPHFRAWLEWRTAPAPLRQYMVHRDAEGTAARMRGEGLREWLWLAWGDRLGLPMDDWGLGIGDWGLGAMDGTDRTNRTDRTDRTHGTHEPCDSDWAPTPDAQSVGCNPHSAIPTPQSSISNPQSAIRNRRSKSGPRIVGLVGPAGCGKTTTLAKMASIVRHRQRQNPVIVTLDTFRIGATEQWRRAAKLMGITVETIVSPEELNRSMDKWCQYDWVGIDTPGGMSSQSAAGRHYGAILARCSELETLLVLPATDHEAASRAQMTRARALGARGVIASKMDETPLKGGIVNLTMDGQWTLDSLTMGPRVPDDWTPADRGALWRHVLAEPTEPSAAGVDS
jgi:flagellar biosynthesis GTPase FlhF